MSLEIVDELMTPGCPQCAIKHLSAALSYSAEAFAQQKRYGVPVLPPPAAKLLLARAYINLGEVLIGYESHLWFAVGLLQRAEEEALCQCSPPAWPAHAREARLVLERDGRTGVRHAMQVVGGVLFGPADMEAAHLEEARRELPVNDGDYLDYAGAIERIRKEYFDLPEAMVAEGETTTKQGEPEMATTKKAACKGGSCSPKGKCAEKGGTTSKVAKAAAKAAKACAKGGKCCKK